MSSREAGDCGGAGCWSQDPLDRPDQAPGVGTETLVPDKERVTPGQPGQALRQILPTRHDRAFNKDRNDPHAAGQGSLNFQPDDVIGIIQPPITPLVDRGQPSRADDRQQRRLRCSGRGYGEMAPPSYRCCPDWCTRYFH